MGKGTLKGSMTIEMSVIIPFILVIVMGGIMTLFYYHDKNIIYAAAYETAVVGSMDMREKEFVTEDELSAFCIERLKKKCILMTSYEIKVTIRDEEVIVKISSVKNGYRIQAEKKAPVTRPEKRIRDVRRLDI